MSILLSMERWGSLPACIPFPSSQEASILPVFSPLISKSDTDISQSIQCSNCNWNALIKTKQNKMSISISNNGKKCLKGKWNTPRDSWPCLSRYTTIAPFLPIAYPPKLRVELTGKIWSQLLITYLALNHQSQELGGYN